MRADPFNDAAVAFAQRVLLARLQELQPERAIRAQAWLGDKEATRRQTWEPWQTLSPGARLWTRSVLLCELVCDVDTPDKALNEQIAQKWVRGARALGADAWGPVDSAGRGWHAHVFVDADSFYLDGKLLDQAEKHSVDVWKTIRESLFGFICWAAELTEAEYDALDVGKVAWTAAKQGSLVRCFGSPGGLGYAKTLGDVPMVVTPDELPQLWAPQRFAYYIEERIAEQIETAKRAKDDAKTAKRELKAARSALDAHPCVREALKNGAPVGERGTTGLHLLRLCRVEGLSAEQAAEVARAYVAACEKHGKMSDDIVSKVGYVYAQPPGGIKCPNPLGLSVCESNTGCPKRRLCLTS